MAYFSPKDKDFDALHHDFRWQIPTHLNIAHEICDKHQHTRGDAIAIYYENDRGEQAEYTFSEVHRYANQLANLFTDLGVRPGDRVAVILPQRLETALVHLAAHKIGAISVPLSILFGPEALLYRLQDSGTKVLITNQLTADKASGFRKQLPQLETVLVCDQSTQNQLGLWQQLAQQPDTHQCVNTLAEDAALLIYTSGTTGPPKGALIPHRALLGNLTGFELSQNFFPIGNDVFYTPADWAWTGGLWDGLLPTWYFARPVLAYEGKKFDPRKTLELLQKYRITTGFFPPTALKMLRQVEDIGDYKLCIRAMMSAGETVGEELISWGRQVFGIEINEMCGQTEHNYMIGNCSAIMPVKPGSMGKPYPGHRVAVMDEAGKLLTPGETGEFVAHKNDAVHFLGYWQKPQATADKYTGDWFHTGDIGYEDEDGYLWFLGRKDDVISSAGYRIGPGEIENCLLKHPAVLQAAVIGVPDPEDLRGNVIKAYIVLKPGYKPDPSLASDIQTEVRHNLAAYEYPRQVAFIDALPMTTTGKVRRLELRRLEGLD